MGLFSGFGDSSSFSGFRGIWWWSEGNSSPCSGLTGRIVGSDKSPALWFCCPGTWMMGFQVLWRGTISTFCTGGGGGSANTFCRGACCCCWYVPFGCSGGGGWGFDAFVGDIKAMPAGMDMGLGAMVGNEGATLMAGSCGGACPMEESRFLSRLNHPLFCVVSWG